VEIFSELAALPVQPRTVAIGAFDGVHIGHQRVIGTAVSRARAAGITASVLTFRQHPLAVVDPVRKPRTLTPLPVKIRLISELGPDELVLLEFDRALAELSPDVFCAAVLADALNAKVVVVGENFRFGRHGEGTPAMLAATGQTLGFEAVVVPLVTEAGKTISSTRIRTLLQKGALEEVREILGRPPTALGTVVPGDRRGRTLGFPTANVEVIAEMIFPGRGVYAARAQVDGVWYRAAVNIGHNPTFQSPDADTTVVRVEAFLLDFTGDVYGRSIRVDFLHKIRDEQRFAGPAELVAQMQIDIGVAADLSDVEFDRVGLGH
jgi:riboflavin kinase/FMN adenylyltransferase